LIRLTDLPAVNACLNATSALLLTAGFVFIKGKRVTAHKVCMISAVGVGLLFLTCYLIYHFQVGATRFAGQGWIRPLYFCLLISHTGLAIAMLPLILMTLARAFRGRFDRHKAIAKITLPIWWYVSVTGVLVYFMLYQWFPSR
jgi:putative membrane protein